MQYEDRAKELVKLIRGRQEAIKLINNSIDDYKTQLFTLMEAGIIGEEVTGDGVKAKWNPGALRDVFPSCVDELKEKCKIDGSATQVRGKGFWTVSGSVET